MTMSIGLLEANQDPLQYVPRYDTQCEPFYGR
jgi:hypothetical protein